jgi:hypothetical protein
LRKGRAMPGSRGSRTGEVGREETELPRLRRHRR